jgi:hypothetical protein
VSLDVLTRRGQDSLQHEGDAVHIWTLHHADITYAETPKTEPADVDAILVRDNTIVGVVEQKSRDMTLDTLTHKYNSEWLITSDKIERGRRVAHALRVPFVGFLYLWPDATLLVQRITNADGSWAASFDTRTTTTQATTNGGTATRQNAYVSMTGARILTKYDGGSYQ